MKRVLVVVDVQNDFVDGTLGSAEAQAAIANICQKITNFEGGLIAVTQDTHSEVYLATMWRLPISINPPLAARSCCRGLVIILRVRSLP